MVNYNVALNNIKNAINLKKKNIKLRKTKYTKNLVSYLITKNILKNMWEIKNWIYFNINEKNKIKITFLNKSFNKKKLLRETKNSSSIFVKNKNTLLARLDF